MSVPLTIKPTISVVGPGFCQTCVSEQSLLLSVRLGKDAIPPICLFCLQQKQSIGVTLVLDEPEPPSGVRPPTRAMQKKEQRQNRRIAADTGGRVQPASGALPGCKGDVRIEGNFRVQSKTCRNKGFRLDREGIDKARADCGKGEDFALVVDFLDPRTQKEVEQVVVMDYHVWRRKICADDDR